MTAIPDIDLKDGTNSSILQKPYYKFYVFPFGAFLRKTGLDELPQLLNILKGEMSFVGPRPLSINDLNAIKKNFPSYYDERAAINTLPGLSGLWQVNKNYECDIENLIDLDQQYCNNQSFGLDLRIILKSLNVILSAKHHDSIIFKEKTAKVVDNTPVYFD